MSFPELAFLETLLETIGPEARIRQMAKIQYSTETFPIYSVCFGSENPEAPSLTLVGGVHGQEKIGSQVVLSYLESLVELLRWDVITQETLKKVRISFLPIVNPVGMFLLRRGNANRVDLMRNGPLDALDSTIPLLCGQRLSPYLPWYRGKKEDPMEIEAQVLCDFVRQEAFASKVAVALDCHSGYGAVDRLWFPYSRSIKPFPDLAETFALKNLLDNTYPNHVYRMEPGSQGYTIGGDLWDYLYEEHKIVYGDKKRFLPITLEMGSWLWLKKNPVQLFSAMGLFHPMHLHRHKRILRRHITLLDFLLKAVVSAEEWAFPQGEEKRELHKAALDHWYFE